MDWGILVMFAGLFVLMEALSANGVVSLIAQNLPALNAASPASSIAPIVIAGVILSQVVSNVPMVALYLPIMASLGFVPRDAYAWTALAGGSTLAGNLTIPGLQATSSPSSRRGSTARGCLSPSSCAWVFP